MATDQIKADRFLELKQRVKAECLRRAYNGSVASYGGAEYDYVVSPEVGKVVLEEHREKIATPLNAINSDQVSQTSGERIVQQSDLTAMEAFVTTLEKRTKTDKTGSDCKSGCTGMCYNCTGICTGTCSGTCDGGCVGCGSSCSNNCSRTCSGTCRGTCKNGCRGCGNMCSTSCSGTCKGGCDTTCTGCRGTCSTSCTAECSSGCRAGAK